MIVATTNDALAPIALAAVEAGKHVLVEKPAARTVAEIDRTDRGRRARTTVGSGSDSIIAITRRSARRDNSSTEARSDR